jgi:hypothetical protein
VHESTYLALLVFHQRLIRDGVNLAHIHVRIFVRIKYALRKKIAI